MKLKKILTVGLSALSIGHCGVAFAVPGLQGGPQSGTVLLAMAEISTPDGIPVEGLDASGWKGENSMKINHSTEYRQILTLSNLFKLTPEKLESLYRETEAGPIPT